MFYLKYHMYRQYFPLMALTTYAKVDGGGATCGLAQSGLRDRGDLKRDHGRSDFADVDGGDLRPQAEALSGRKQYPLVLMLEPLFRCNLACAGCGKIQYPAHV